MAHSIPHEDWSDLADGLQRRAADLRGALAEAHTRAAAERYPEVASEAPDRGDAAVADLVVDVNSARLERDTREIRDIEDALERLRAGTYGVCLRCGQPIERARLEAVPTTKYDRACMERTERDRGVPRPATL